MSLAAKSLPVLLQVPENISILLVSPHVEDLTVLSNILHNRQWVITRCDQFRDASEHIASGGYSIVVTERTLPDGSWKDILKASQSQSRPPLVLVACHNADDSLWAEVLNLGGYDVLLKPFDRGEVTRVLGMAWRRFGNARKPAASQEAATCMCVSAGR